MRFQSTFFTSHERASTVLCSSSLHMASSWMKDMPDGSSHASSFAARARALASWRFRRRFTSRWPRTRAVPSALLKGSAVLLLLAPRRSRLLGYGTADAMRANLTPIRVHRRLHICASKSSFSPNANCDLTAPLAVLTVCACGRVSEVSTMSGWLSVRSFSGMSRLGTNMRTTLRFAWLMGMHHVHSPGSTSSAPSSSPALASVKRASSAYFWRLV
mmetsp:Transcript_17515/g.59875  ORF Transcript_17515/g.59875 Transcript_17515/m.59875 type:complete len:216 (+) Transcript_17515:2206-2853(+)